MSGQADVKSIDTLAFVKAALASFAHEAGQALGEVELEGRRGVEYVTMERAAHWKTEVRKAGDAVNKAIKDLEHCRAFKKVGDNTPSCVEEKKNLDKARKRLEFAEQKEAAVRRWKPVVEQQFRETCVRLVHFREVIDVNCPKAMAVLERMLKALDAYRQTQGPAAGGAGGGSGTAASMARPADEAPAGAQAPAVDQGPRAAEPTAGSTPPATTGEAQG
jgi:hypothetical protein